MRNFIRGHMVASEDIEDVVQDVFARLMDVDNLEARLASSTGSNRSFIFSIANSLVIDQARHKKVRRNYREQHLYSDAESHSQPSPESHVAASRELAVMKRVLMEMRPTWRNAFILNRFKHLSYREVAKSMGVSLKQVEHFMAKAIDRIQKAEQRLLDRHGDQS